MAGLSLPGVATRLTELGLVALALSAIAATAARAAGPLELTLESSREVCTANTLTELSWTISGGEPPYALSIEGEEVDPDSGPLQVDCGPLPVDPEGNRLSAGTKTFSASVADSSADPQTRTARVELDLAEPLPAPDPHFPSVSRNRITISWPAIAGAASEDRRSRYLIRWRPAGELQWNYELVDKYAGVSVPGGGFGGLDEQSTYQYALATLRDPLEQHTPDALLWSSQQEAATTTTPSGVAASSTHDAITVSWDDQPSVARVTVRIRRADGAGLTRWVGVRRDETPPNQTTLIDLDPDTEYEIRVGVPGRDQLELLETLITVTTAAAPSGWTAPARGAQNVQVATTTDSFTITWEAPLVNTRDRWFVIVRHPQAERSYTDYVSAPLTFSLDRLWPGNTYTVILRHRDLHYVEVTTTVTTDSADAALSPSETLPTLPVGLAVEETSDSLTLSWAAVEDATGYEVRLGAYGEVEAATGLSHEFTDLNDDTDYLLHVRATDAKSSSGWTSLRGRTLEADLATPPQTVVQTDDSDPDVLVYWYPTTGASGYKLTLESSREVCTANTLTELSWTISGGEPPYALSIEGEEVDPDSGPLQVDCGPLPVDPEGNRLSAGTKTFSASVADSSADPQTRTARVELDLAEPLPAPDPHFPSVSRTAITISWPAIAGAASEDRRSRYLIRWRPAGELQWNYELVDKYAGVSVPIGGFEGLDEQSTYQYALATLRDPLEQHTPDALLWSSQQEATTTTTPSGVAASSTHDAITVSWDDQPSVARVTVRIRRADGAGLTRWVGVRRDETPPNQTTLIDLDPDTEYEITVGVPGWDQLHLLETLITVTTAAAPSGWTAPARGAQNVQVATTTDSFTITWEAPLVNTSDRWFVIVRHPEAESSYTDFVSAPLTFSLDRLWPGNTYTVILRHLDLHYVEVTTTVTTDSADAALSPSETLPPFVGGPPGPILEFEVPAYSWPYGFSTTLEMTADPWSWRSSSNSGAHVRGGDPIRTEFRPGIGRARCA